MSSRNFYALFKNQGYDQGEEFNILDENFNGDQDVKEYYEDLIEKGMSKNDALKEAWSAVKIEDEDGFDRDQNISNTVILLKGDDKEPREKEFINYCISAIDREISTIEVKIIVYNKTITEYNTMRANDEILDKEQLEEEKKNHSLKKYNEDKLHLLENDLKELRIKNKTMDEIYPKLKAGLIKRSQYNSNIIALISVLENTNLKMDLNIGQMISIKEQHNIPLDQDEKEYLKIAVNKRVPIRSRESNEIYELIRTIFSVNKNEYKNFDMLLFIPAKLSPPLNFTPFIYYEPRTARGTRIDLSIKQQRKKIADFLYSNPNTPKELKDRYEKSKSKKIRQDIFKYYKLFDAPDDLVSCWTNYDVWRCPRNERINNNCLLDILIHKYYTLPPKCHKLQIKSIEKFFSEENGGTSIENLLKFSIKFNIPLRLYLISHDKPFVSREADGTKNRRSGLALMIYDHHCYIFNGDYITDSKPQLKEEMANYAELNPETKSKLELSYHEAEAIKFIVSKAGHPNFSFLSEKEIGIKSLMYSKQGVAETGEMNYGIDMNKAFWTGLIKSPDNSKIPVFTPMDDIIKYNGEEILSEAYYFVSEECYKSWETNNRSLLCARLNNMLHGFEAIYLIEQKDLQIKDITHYKKPTYTISSNTFIELLDEVAKKTEQTTCRNKFLLYNGILGKKEYKPKHKSFLVSNTDEELINNAFGLNSEAVEQEQEQETTEQIEVVECLNDPTISTVNIIKGETEYKYTNTRNLYYFVIARTNMELMIAYNKSLLIDKKATLVKVRVDCIGWIVKENSKLFNYMPDDFKFEIKKVPQFQFGRYYIDPDMLRDEMKSEIDVWTKEHTVIYGSAGSGKTFKVQHEFLYDKAMAITNVCARNLTYTREKKSTENSLTNKETIQGETIHKVLGIDKNGTINMNVIKKKLKNKTIWCDEISQLNPYYWSILYSIGMTTKFILTGDPNQCSPIRSDKQGKMVGDPLHWKTSLFLKSLLSNGEKLTTQHRNIDQHFMEFINAIETHSNPLLVVNKLLEKYPKNNATKMRDADIYNIDSHLVFGNNYRLQLNEAILKHRGLKFNVSKERSNQFEASKGVRVRATVGNDNYGKHECFIINEEIEPTEDNHFKEETIKKSKKQITEDKKIALKNDRLVRLLNRATNNTIYIPLEQLRDFEVNYAMTTYSSQGLTIKEPTVIHNTTTLLDGSEHKDIFYTAITRLQKLDHLFIHYNKVKSATEINIDDIINKLKTDEMKSLDHLFN